MRYTLTLLLGLSTLIGESQIVTLTNEDQTANYNGAVVDVWAPTENGQMGFPMECVLNADGPRQINMRRYELSYPAGYTGNSYCWGECYNSDTTGDHPVWPAPQTVVMYPDSLTAGFHAYYDPHGIMGVAAFRFVWFDNATSDDSTWTDIVFHASATGISGLATSDLGFKAFPVPSTTGRVEFTFGAMPAGHQAQIEFHDVLGNLLFSEALSNGQQSLILPPGKLAKGVWFASLRVDGRMVATKRVVVTGG